MAINSDFNVTLNPNEHSARSSSITTDMMEFKDCINQVEVEDLSSVGLYFTWKKNLQKVKLGDYSGILKKLDRVLVNEDFISKYPQARAIFLPYLISDHSPALLIIPNEMRRKKKSFKFANYITKKEDFCKIVKEVWSTNVGGLCMLKEDLRSIQVAIDADPHNQSLRERGSVILGDYMEAMLKVRYQSNRIQVIHDINGKIFEGDQVAQQFVNHFKNLLGVNVPVTPVADCDSIFTTKLSERYVIFMIRPVTDKEIKATMFSIDDNKAPGPEGYSAKKFKKAWHIIGIDVCSAMKEFFTSVNS
ncbi:RNA-directed DNA polymerase, eukaryota, reverse transcriptase zinc-binding domain protein [Tanacetum coccineum]